MSGQNVKVICLLGMPGAGKSSCVTHLEQKGWPSVYFGGITIDEVKARGLEVNEANEKLVREDIRAKEGIGAYAVRIVAKIDALVAEGQQVVIADGLYGWTEYKTFKEKYGDNAVMIAIVAPRHLRHERLARRPVRPLSEADATARDYAEIEKLEKGGPIANADYTIVNDGTVETMLTKLDGILGEFLA
ncbi:MAG TPA: AAA family ATPase [Candidatus Saccharimonadales bacterium]|nr:AAA family ATPase [Candidatus Saccharimonadales bacterium]